MALIKNFYYFIKVLFQQRYVIHKLVARDFQKKYLASYLGLPWAFIHPLSIILVLWFVIFVGLRGGDLGDDTPFFPWFIGGMIPWFFLKEGIQNSSSSLIDYSFLIKKMYFRVGMIPLVRIATALIIHCFLIVVLIIFLFFFEISPTIYWIQIPYYIFCSVVFLVGFGWFASSIMVFVRDVKQAIEVFLTLFFWITPIIWPYTRLVGNARYIADLNPIFYITNGYRETFIYGKWFFERTDIMLYFWLIALFFFIVGAYVFQKLKPHFADVL